MPGLAASELAPVPDVRPTQCSGAQVLPSRNTYAGTPDDACSEAGTCIDSAMSSIDEKEDTCKFYTIKDNVIYDLKGVVQSQKWAKRMRQKERDEQAKSTAASSSAAGAGKGAMAIAAPETAPKAEHALVSRTGINKSKGKPENPVAGRLIATWPLVDCSTETCDTRARWNIMFQTRGVIKDGGSGKWGDDADPEEITKYWCTLCMAKTWGCKTRGGAGQDLGGAPWICQKARKERRVPYCRQQDCRSLSRLKHGQKANHRCAAYVGSGGSLGQVHALEMRCAPRTKRVHGRAQRTPGAAQECQNP